MRGHLGHAEIAIAARGLLSLDILAGQITVIAGPAAAGKSRLLRLLAGLERPGAGAVWIGERRIDAGPGRPSARFRSDERAFVGPEASAPGGREAAILRALAPDPALAFIDEPVAGLAVGELDRVHASLYALTSIAGKTAVVATSNPAVAAWGQRLLLLEGGALVLDLDSPTPAEARGVLRATR